MSHLESLVDRLKSRKSGSVELPAGHGKTELIMEVATRLSFDNEKVLILTHTNAGVQAIRQRFLKSRFAIPKDVAIRTIDSFCRSWALSFPVTCGFHDRVEVETCLEFERLQTGIIGGLKNNRHIRRIMSTCFDYLLVDEYQDCTLTQHQMIHQMEASCAIPTLVVGDRLQSIFLEKNDASTEVWESRVERAFPPCEFSASPFRWFDSNTQLGTWITEMRSNLLAGDIVDYCHYRYNVDPTNQQYLVNAVKRIHSIEDNLVIIDTIENRRMSMARTFGIDMQFHEKRHHTKFHRLSTAFIDPAGRYPTHELLKIVKSSVTRFGEILSKPQMANIGEGRPPRFRSPEKQKLGILIEESLASGTPLSLGFLLDWLLVYPEIRIYRKSLLMELRRVFRRMHELDGTFDQCRSDLNNEMRTSADRLPPILITSPWLFKGLQTSTVIVMYPETMTPEQFYVSASRASHRLWFISETNQFVNFFK